MTSKLFRASVSSTLRSPISLCHPSCNQASIWIWKIARSLSISILEATTNRSHWSQRRRNEPTLICFRSRSPRRRKAVTPSSRWRTPILSSWRLLRRRSPKLWATSLPKDGANLQPGRPRSSVKRGGMRKSSTKSIPLPKLVRIRRMISLSSHESLSSSTTRCT